MKNSLVVWIKNSISRLVVVHRFVVLILLTPFLPYIVHAQDHINMDFVFVSSNATQADFDIVLTNDGTTSLKFNAITLRGNNDEIVNIATSGSIVTASALQNNTNPAWTIIGNTWPGNSANVVYLQGGVAFKLNYSSESLFFAPGNRPTLPIGIPVNIGRFRLSIAGGTWIPNSQLNYTWHALAGVVCEIANGSLITLNTTNTTVTRTVSVNQLLNPSATGIMSGNGGICANIGSANINVDITGGSGPYELVYTNGTTNDTVFNYLSGTPIPVSPNVATTYTIVSIDGFSFGHSGSATISIVASSLLPDSASLVPVNEECSVSSTTPPTATSSCYGTIIGTPDVLFPISTLGTTTVTWTFDDGNGSTISQTQQVIITDNIAPVPDIASLPNLTGNCSMVLTPPSASDACMGVVSGTSDITSPITDSGLTVVTWTYDDGNGNISTQTQNVTINSPNTSVTLNGATLTATSSTASYHWLDCNNNYAEIPTATNQSFTPSDLNGSYALALTEFGCSDTSICYDLSLVGLDEKIRNIEIHIYPNPTVDIVNIDMFGLNRENLEMRITDLTGRQISTEKIQNISGNYALKIDVSRNENGIYIINLIGENGIILSERIVKY